jgi:hypothetical protein
VPWVLLDVAIGVLALALLGMVGYLLYKRVRALMRTVGTASAQVGELTPGLTVTPPPPH